jgi:uncharacterized membrane protein
MDRPTDALLLYLEDLRARLHRLPDAEVADILEELRSHVRDRVGAGEDAEDTLQRLGTPAELAPLYITDRMLTRAGRTASPALVAGGLIRWATMSAGGALALAGLLLAYVLAASFFLAAVVKPLAPTRAGLWWLEGGEISLRMGLASSAPPAGRELLGWWIVPIGLLLGMGALWLAPRFGGWLIRTFRPASRLPLR